MPACITHNLFARDVLARLRESVDECACFWGAQGPDFLFCHRYFQSALKKTGASLKEYGSALHRDPPSATLNAMRDFLSRHSDPSYRSYVLGFLCHYALDSTAHPFVNARARELAERRPGENPSTMHGEIEASLDAIVLRWKTGKLPSEVKLGDMFPKNEGAQRKIACLYQDVLSTVYGAQVSQEELYQATKDAHFVFACCTDRTGLKRGLFRVIEKGRPSYVASHLVPITEDPEPDFANTAHKAWTYKDEAHTEDFFELYQKALENRERRTYTAATMEEILSIANDPEKTGFIRTMWCEDPACEARMKEEAGVTSRCMPLEQERLYDVCPICGKPAKSMIIWGKAY